MIVLIGAGSVSFTRGQAAELALVDTDENALLVAENFSRKMIEAKQAPFDLVASTNRRDVIQSATVVICTIGDRG